MVKQEIPGPGMKTGGKDAWTSLDSLFKHKTELFLKLKGDKDHSAVGDV